jgi:O-antigen ligase
MSRSETLSDPGALAADRHGRPRSFDSDAAAAAEQRREKRARRSVSLLASRVLARHRARFLPLMFALLILQPATVELASGRDLSTLGQDLFEEVEAPPWASRAGRVMTLALLGLAGVSCVAWFTSKHRGQEQRASRTTSRRRRSSQMRGRAGQRAPASVSGMGDAARPGAGVGALPAVVAQGAVAPRDGAAAAGSRRASARRRHSAARAASSPVRSLPVQWLLAGALAFSVVCHTLPQLVGLDPRLPLQTLYAPLLILALYAGRRLPHRAVLDAVQWSIATVMVAGLAIHPFLPSTTSSIAGLEQRLPFFDTRFWGLGSGPNSIAPLAIVQLLLQLHQHRRPSPFWWLANGVAAAAALLVLLWAQSQTAWAAAALVLPFAMLRSSLDTQTGRTAFKPHHVVSGLFVSILVIGYIGAELINSGALQAVLDLLPGERSGVWKSGSFDTATAIGDQVMTGRGQIWAVALDVWRDNPWLGFGGRAWDFDFRHYYGLHYAVHAHSQPLQALSVSGLVGFSVFAVYFGALAWFSWKASAPSRGLTLALFVLILVRTVTEVPLELGGVTTADAATHLLLLYLVFAYGSRVRKRPGPA